MIANDNHSHLFIMLPSLLLLLSMLCRAHAGRRAVLRRAGLAGMGLALGLAIQDAGVERGLAAWLAGALACGALAPMILLVLEGAGKRLASAPALPRRHSSAAAK